MTYTLDDFDYSLPSKLIAQHPARERTASRLLHVAPAGLRDLTFSAIESLLAPGDVLVFNDTRVIKARLHGEKDSGGRVEVLVERILDANELLAHVRASKSPKPRSRLRLAHAIDAEVLGRRDDLYHLRFADDVLALLDRHGEVPLPPYIRHRADNADEARYQTVYARNAGAVAAPTAGLHFDEPLLGRLRTRGVKLAYLTLHVGAGTFQPVRADRIDEHVMHSEWFSIPAETVTAIEAARAAGRNVIACGTTSLRALESAARDGTLRSGSADTQLFITPGYQFRVVDRLITNFHLPKSTLMMLVSAFAGLATIRNAYAHAVDQEYRFFSYGDAMLLERNDQT